jgi:hypothetical protein
MLPLSAASIVRLWEEGGPLRPFERAAALLALATPELSEEARGALSIGERDARILALRVLTLGPQLDCFAECPRCRERLQFALPAAPLLEASQAPQDSAAPALPQEHALSWRAYRVRYRPVTTADLAAVIPTPDAAAPDAEGIGAALLWRCLLSVQRDGVDVDFSARPLPRALVRALVERLGAADPGAETLLSLACPACAYRWQSVLDVASFFWDELATRARRLLREVHTLARAYGWREAEILALPGRRRQSYLELVGA